MTDFKLARKNMVDCQIHTYGVVTDAILDAFRTMPREKFVPAHLTGIAYHDEDLAIGGGRSLLAPAVMARMMEKAEISSTDRVLDIGGTNGYAACILASVAAHVTALEDKPEFTQKLAEQAKALRISNVTPVTGSLAAGYADGGPYDLIFINGAINFIPDALVQQLKPGGRLMAIFKDKGAVMGQAILARRGNASGEISSYPLFEAAGATLPGLEARTTFNFGR